MATGPMGIKVVVFNPNPSPNSPGNTNEIQMTCKWGRLDEFINNNFIWVGINYLTIIFSFLLACLLACLLAFSFHRWSLWGIYPQRSNPVEGVGRILLCVECTRLSGAPPQRSLPFWGPLALAQILPEEKRPSPERVARNHARVEQVSSLSGWPKAPSGVPGSPLSFFLERTYTGSPSEYKRFPPTGEKPQDPWGPSWLRLSSARDESWPCLER